MKKSKYIIFILLTLFTAVFFASCTSEGFKNTISCNEIEIALEKEFNPQEQGFSQYTDDELKFLFPSTKIYDDAIIIYSNDSVDITEIGILHASSEKNANALFEEARLYIKELQEQKREFLQSYSPSEVPRLNSAEARRFGEYVVFAVASSEEKDVIFTTVESILKQ